MKKNGVWIISALLLAIAISIYLGSCENPLEQDDDNDTAIITGRVFTDEFMDTPVGVNQVRAQVTGDPTSDVPYQGTLVYDYTDANGVYEIHIPLGSYNNATSTGTGEYYEYKARYVAGVILTLIYSKYKWEKSGITVSRGRKYYMWDVSLDKFANTSGGE
ncbi:MAG: hypothetical protein JXA60_10645 [Candidatus Coatesbacteria bacterium]|nr:hypothetical protein [Candidatus Coatesbacteria bacterium]